jgi:hypothetical protein
MEYLDWSIIAAAVATYSFFIFGLWIFFVIVGWKIFEKAGQPGWAALIPFYNLYVYTQIIRRPPWWMILYFAGIVPFIGAIGLLILSIVDSVRLSRVFGKPDVFAVGLIILGFLFYPILAFGNSEYDTHAVDAPAG